MTPLNVPIPSINELTQNAARLLQQSLAQAAQAGNTATLSAADLELARSNVKAFSFVQGVGLHGAYRYLRDFIARQAVPIFSAKAFLDGWLATYRMVRKEAAAASGQVSGTGVNTTILPAGTLLQAADGDQYRVSADATVAAGVVTATVVALIAGVAGNREQATALTLVSPVVGIDSAFAVDVDGISGGAEVESDSEAIYRLQQRLGNEPLGGSPADYARWALQLSGITRAWGVRNPAGPTSAGVIIMADGNVPPGLPTEGQRVMVRDYILDPRRGPPDELFVIIPDAQAVDPVIGLSPDSASARAACTAALKDVFFREATPGQGLPISHLSEAISQVTGEYNHTLEVGGSIVVSGGMLTVSAFDELLVLGNPTYV
jgi:uncharacterized phage protein gp47/JayE